MRLPLLIAAFLLGSLALPADTRLRIDYSPLVDKGALIRTGQSLGSALGSSGLKGALQPFLDKYSTLLEYAVEMVSHEDAAFTDVVDTYPVGAVQPAWVALFRSGAMSAYTDNKRTVRLFLPGKNPAAAYNENYSIVRHSLNARKPLWGKLRVEIYAFENDYRTLSLRLSRVPAVVEGAYFGAPSGKVALDLAGLRDFFNQGGQLEGAQLNEKTGLLLYAKAAPAQTLAGTPLQLADFAVAYRAVFHAGDNKAFISLDPHRDVTKAAVNFGGFLEDTAMGKVVLDADKRFKTMTSGLDPNSGSDIRAATRRTVPNFLTVSERDFLAASTKNGWIKTRFWFYPDSIVVQTDPTQHFARIINPQFLADAERSRDDFTSSAEFEKKKKALLLPAIRESIDDLNQHYDQYAQAFSEFRELQTVGRLMAICSWLDKVHPRWLDMDALLAVELPVMRTERERTQLMAATMLSDGSQEKTPENVKKNLTITYLTPALDKSLGNFFADADDLAKFLALKSGGDDKKALPEAERLYKNHNHDPVKMLIQSQQDLQAFAIFAGSRIRPSTQIEYAQLDEEKIRLDKKRQDISLLEARLRNGEKILPQYNEVVEAFQSSVNALNSRVLAFNQKERNRSSQLVEIGGGINLESQSFKINTVQTSPQLSTLKDITAKAKPEWTDVSKGEKWVTNKVSPFKPAAQKPTVFAPPPPAPRTVRATTGPARPSSAKTTIIVRTTDPAAPTIKGEWGDANTIVFRAMAK